MRKFSVKTKIRGTDTIYTKNKGTNKTNFIGLRCEAKKIILKTCKCLFTKEISGKSIIIKCNKGVKKWQLIISA